MMITATIHDACAHLDEQLAGAKWYMGCEPGRDQRSAKNPSEQQEVIYLWVRRAKDCAYHGFTQDGFPVLIRPAVLRSRLMPECRGK